MTFPRYRELKKGWRRNPPVHFLLAAIMDYEPPSKEIRLPSREIEVQVQETSEEQEQSLEVLIRDFTAAGGAMNGSYNG